MIAPNGIDDGGGPLPEDDVLVETDEEIIEGEEGLVLADGRPALKVPSTNLPTLLIGTGFALLLVGFVLLFQSEQALMPGLVLATGVVLAGAGAGVLATRRRTPTAPYVQPELNRAPDSIDTTTVARHGDVNVGRTRVREPDGNPRDYISIWIVPSAGNACGAAGAYRWYQFVRINFFIDGRRKRLRRGIKGATGLTYPFNEWAPDYHQGDPGTVGPDLTPPGLTPAPGNPGKPFRPYGIGGQLTAGGTSLRTGVIDAPNFCERGRDALSPIERLHRRFLRPREVERPRPPPDVNRTLKVEVEVRTYLVCVTDGQAQCIGYVGWSYTNEADVRLTWTESGTALGANKKWVLGSEILATRHTLTIAGWTAGC